jgi:hypothetical protein
MKPGRSRQSNLSVLFPRLTVEPFAETSAATPQYNCIAWAMGDQSRCWWPDAYYYWPAGLLRTPTFLAFRAMLESFGFEVCESEDLEAGFEKVALYGRAAGDVTHAARQLGNGRWTSKLGKLQDIEHTLCGLQGAQYGTVLLIMRRALV